ncbi:hypothetical protein A2U01_0082768, partial [Trifolium medium]|nr:hypothetical protein [Trifolium medium]
DFSLSEKCLAKLDMDR